MHIQARAHGEKEIGRQKFVQRIHSRPQIPFLREFGESQPGKERSNDGSQPQPLRYRAQPQANGQCQHQLRIMRGEPLHAGLHPVHQARSDEHHEQHKTDGFRCQHAQLHPVRALRAHQAHHQRQQHHAQYVVEYRGAQNDLCGSGFQ